MKKCFKLFYKNPKHRPICITDETYNLYGEYVLTHNGTKCHDKSHLLEKNPNPNNVGRFYIIERQR